MTIKPFTQDGQSHLLGYKNKDGTVAIDKINAGGEGTAEFGVAQAVVTY